MNETNRTQVSTQAAGPALRVGIDLCAVEDVTDAIERFGDRYLHRIYTDSELAACRTAGTLQPERLAGRFAAKEATVKVLRPDDAGIDLRSIEIERQPGGWCDVHLAGTAAALATAAGLGDVAISLTHEHGMAAAVAVAQSRRTDDAPRAALGGDQP